jgi:GDP-4-dehydro-6-deoxy-D-mannose reductase
VYNLGSSHAIQMREIVDIVQQQGRARADIQVDPARLRPVDEPILMGDTRKLRAATGWEPQIDMAQIVDELLAFWRARS